MSTLASLYRLETSVDQVGFRHGLEAKPRMFREGDCRSYDAAYNAGDKVRRRESLSKTEGAK